MEPDCIDANDNRYPAHDWARHDDDFELCRNCGQFRLNLNDQEVTHAH